MFFFLVVNFIVRMKYKEFIQFPLLILDKIPNFHGQRSLTGYSPWGHKESGIIEHTQHTHIHTHTHTHTVVENKKIGGNHCFSISVVYKEIYSMLFSFHFCSSANT